MAPYRVVVDVDVTTRVALLSETEQEHVLIDLALTLGRDPHDHGDVWMTAGSEVWRVLNIGQARLVFVVDDGARSVAFVGLTAVRC